MEVIVGDMKITINAIASDSLFGDTMMLMGMDVINQLGGVTIFRGSVIFGKISEIKMGINRQEKPKEGVGCGAVYNVDRGVVKEMTEDAGGECEKISDVDFEALFDGEVWTVEWVWKDQAPVLKNRLSGYNTKLDAEKIEMFDKEVERWIEEGILLPWGEQVSVGVIPLMAIVQPTKKKIRPVLDFRELNNFVSCHTGDDVTDVCGETMRDWRRMNAETLAELKAAYLQIRVAEKLWKYQLVNYKGRTYCLTRLGFGLNSAPRIMAKILKTVLSKT